VDLHGGQLLEAIFAQPADDAPRRIFADWLLEQSEPGLRAWGRLITAQLDEDVPTTWRMLPHARGHACLDWPAAGVLDREITRGFLTRVRLGEVSAPEVDALSRRLVWGVVRFLDTPLQAHPNLTAVLAGAAARGRLRALGTFFGHSDSLDAVAAADPTPRLDLAVVQGPFSGGGLALVRSHGELRLQHALGFSLQRNRGADEVSLFVDRTPPLDDAALEVAADFVAKLLPPGALVSSYRAPPALVAAVRARGLRMHPPSP
jgi:uncharacterized protein (TIGR02996 family)